MKREKSSTSFTFNCQIYKISKQQNFTLYSKYDYDFSRSLFLGCSASGLKIMKSVPLFRIEKINTKKKKKKRMNQGHISRKRH